MTAPSDMSSAASGRRDHPLAHRHSHRDADRRPPPPQFSRRNSPAATLPPRLSLTAAILSHRHGSLSPRRAGTRGSRAITCACAGTRRSWPSRGSRTASSESASCRFGRGLISPLPRDRESRHAFARVASCRIPRVRRGSSRSSVVQPWPSTPDGEPSRARAFARQNPNTAVPIGSRPTDRPTDRPADGPADACPPRQPKTTVMDDNVVVGALPFRLDVAGLRHELGVTGVVNMCEEWGGPKREYEKLGVEQLRLPTQVYNCKTNGRASTHRASTHRASTHRAASSRGIHSPTHANRSGCRHARETDPTKHHHPVVHTHASW